MSPRAPAQRLIMNDFAEVALCLGLHGTDSTQENNPPAAKSAASGHTPFKGDSFVSDGWATRLNHCRRERGHNARVNLLFQKSKMEH